MEVGLVSCTKSKHEKETKTKDLYLESVFFRKARQYVEANHDAWYILSAKHHLLDPGGEPIEPYDETLSGAPVDTKREWAETVFEQLRTEGLLVRVIGSSSMPDEITMKNSHRYSPRRVLNSLCRQMGYNSVKRSRVTTIPSE